MLENILVEETIINSNNILRQGVVISANNPPKDYLIPISLLAQNRSKATHCKNIALIDDIFPIIGTERQEEYQNYVNPLYIKFFTNSEFEPILLPNLITWNQIKWDLLDIGKKISINKCLKALPQTKRQNVDTSCQEIFHLMWQIITYQIANLDLYITSIKTRPQMMLYKSLFNKNISIVFTKVIPEIKPEKLYLNCDKLTVANKINNASNEYLEFYGKLIPKNFGGNKSKRGNLIDFICSYLIS